MFSYSYLSSLDLRAGVCVCVYMLVYLCLPPLSLACPFYYQALQSMEGESQPGLLWSLLLLTGTAVAVVVAGSCNGDV